MSDERTIRLGSLAALEARTGGSRKISVEHHEAVENVLRWPEGGVSASRLAEILAVSVERVEALEDEGVLSRDGERLFPIQASVDAYVAHQEAAPDAVELMRLRAAEAAMTEVRRRGGLGTAAANEPLFLMKWRFAWSAFLRDKEKRGALGKLRPAVLTKLTLIEFRKHRKNDFGEDNPTVPKEPVMEAWFRKWDRDFARAQAEAERAIAIINESQRAKRNA